MIDSSLSIENVDFNKLQKYVFVNHLVYALGYRDPKDESAVISSCEYYNSIKKEKNNDLLMSCQESSFNWDK